MAVTAYAKWVMGGVGWAIGGPIGAILGFFMGSAFESMDKGEFEHKSTQPGDFRISLLVLSAAVMKADGKQLKSELDYIKAFFLQHFGPDATHNYMLAFRDILKQDIPLEDVCSQIRQYMDFHSRLQLLHFLFGIALADGQVHPEETKTIRQAAHWLGLSEKDFESIQGMFVKDYTSAYKILEIEPEASIDQIKKAFRAMALKYHPDKVSHLGEEFQHAAKEKFQKVNEAYNTIRQERGF